MSALRFFYKKVLKRRDLTLDDLVYPKKPKKLPVVLSQEEVTGLDTANGKVLAQCRSRHRHQEYLSFLREIEKNVPKNLEAHIIVDNYATHKHRRVRRWFATRPRFHVHFTPTYASWLNQVET